MGNIREVIAFPGKSTGACFEGAVKGYPKAGFTVWKKRDIAWLAMAKCMQGNIQIDSNIMVSPGGTPQITLIVSAPELGEKDLRPYVDKISSAIKAEIK
jgi:hypothetical protein